jgi:2-polyprenyl-3-methyl-5-hydroxy-6-metoxy-1,4-benzoquinol methylase
VRSQYDAGSILDFGAGKGNLLLLLAQEEGVDSLCGIDIMERPPSLPTSIGWHQQDLNDEIDLHGLKFDLVVCSEVIEHLENPRATMRKLYKLLNPGGRLILTTPNQHSIRSYASLLFAGHFVGFLDPCYPAHITALLEKDLERICSEAGLENVRFYYTDHGSIPKLTQITWQQVSFGLLRGRWFSDNVAVIAQQPHSDVSDRSQPPF